MTPANKAAKTQLARRQEAENALLDAAEELIAEQGILQTSMAQIGERAGYSRGLANHHFGTKDILVERMMMRAREKFSAKLNLEPAKSGFETIVRTVETYIQAYEIPGEKPPALLVLWGAALTKQSSHASIILEAEKNGLDVTVEIIRQGQLDGSLNEDIDPRSCAIALLGMLRGITAHNLLFPDSLDWQAIRREVARYIESLRA